MYYKQLFGAEREVFYFQVSTGSRELSTPRPHVAVLPFDAHRRNTVLPWRYLCDVLQTVLWANRSKSRYQQLPTHTLISYNRDGASEEGKPCLHLNWYDD